VASLEKTMHETAVRALAQQEAALEALRARTGTVLTAASVIASFLGGQAIARNGLNTWVMCALGAFASVVLLRIDGLIPKRLYFSIDVARTYRALSIHRDDPRSIDRALARLHHDLCRLNAPVVTRLGGRARLAGLALTIEVALLGVGLA
jgi:hypothetical protein